ncbi:Protein of unknown function [Maribacter sedimenticola]|uniref:DUF3124 domain-containing protein n=1 Tax=Maribacter sedimenticola TaxID=228956 RepID=A0ABY1SFT6_9FLAO|nr:Protein of unknown function [Maribacter sedimenticola]
MSDWTEKEFSIPSGKLNITKLKTSVFKIFGYCTMALLVHTMSSCKEVNPKEQPVEILDDHTLNRRANATISDSLLRQVYVPIYSDIYNQTRDTRTLLTATLSIRNTSIRDSLFVSKIDYYNTQGDLVRSYLDAPIYLKPMETIDYVIEQQDTSGGSGANFIIDWYSKKKLNPLFQAVMVGGLGAQAFSFTTEGVEVEQE